MKHSKLNAVFLLHSATVILAFAIIGPHPSDVHPSYASPDLAKVGIPIINESSGQKTPPKIEFIFLGVSYYSRPNYTISTSVEDWGNTAGKLRFRLMQYRERSSPSGKNRISTRVLKAIVENSTYFNSVLEQGCRPLNLYVEICARISDTTRPLCNMTEVKTLPPFVVPIPELKFRPPHVLYLSPGDSARIKTETIPQSSGETYWVRSILQGKNGNTIYRIRQTPLQSSLAFRRRATRRLNGLYLNGSTVFHNYALRSCRSNEQSDQNYKGTRIYVEKTVKPLIKQDNRIPEFDRPQFPLVKQGENVSIALNAQNVGGGIREGGSPTSLYYYWYIRTYIHLPSKYRPFRLIQTTPTLKIENVKCKPHWINSSGNWYGLQQYYVEVCNTYGCRASDIFEPQFISDIPGKKLSPNCILKDI